MRKLTLILLLGLVLQIGVAGAQTQILQISSLCGSSAYIWDYQVHGWMNGGTGYMSGTLGGHPVTNILCVDVYHNFYLGDSWEVTTSIIPPDPIDPPPFDTRDAAYVYHHYKSEWTAPDNDIEAAGVQLALWEVTQEPDWRATWDPDSWWSSGLFKTEYAPNSIDGGSIAQGILADLYLHMPTDAEAGHLVYYKPLNCGKGQGLVGDADSDVPEPGTLVLLGTALLGAAGLTWRRRGSF